MAPLPSIASFLVLAVATAAAFPRTSFPWSSSSGSDDLMSFADTDGDKDFDADDVRGMFKGGVDGRVEINQVDYRSIDADGDGEDDDGTVAKKFHMEINTGDDSGEYGYNNKYNHKRQLKRLQKATMSHLERERLLNRLRYDGDDDDTTIVSTQISVTGGADGDYNDNGINDILEEELLDTYGNPLVGLARSNRMTMLRKLAYGGGGLYSGHVYGLGGLPLFGLARTRELERLRRRLRAYGRYGGYGRYGRRWSREAERRRLRHLAERRNRGFWGLRNDGWRYKGFGDRYFGSNGFRHF